MEDISQLTEKDYGDVVGQVVNGGSSLTSPLQLTGPSYSYRVCYHNVTE